MKLASIDLCARIALITTWCWKPPMPCARASSTSAMPPLTSGFSTVYRPSCVPTGSATNADRLSVGEQHQDRCPPTCRSDRNWQHAAAHELDAQEPVQHLADL